MKNHRQVIAPGQPQLRPVKPFLALAQLGGLQRRYKKIETDFADGDQAGVGLVQCQFGIQRFQVCRACVGHP